MLDQPLSDQRINQAQDKPGEPADDENSCHGSKNDEAFSFAFLLLANSGPRTAVKTPVAVSLANFSKHGDVSKQNKGIRKCKDCKQAENIESGFQDQTGSLSAISHQKPTDRCCRYESGNDPSSANHKQNCPLLDHVVLQRPHHSQILFCGYQKDVASGCDGDKIV